MYSQLTLQCCLLHKSGLIRLIPSHWVSDRHLHDQLLLAMLIHLSLSPTIRKIRRHRRTTAEASAFSPPQVLHLCSRNDAEVKNHLVSSKPQFRHHHRAIMVHMSNQMMDGWWHWSEVRVVVGQLTARMRLAVRGWKQNGGTDTE